MHLRPSLTGISDRTLCCTGKRERIGLNSSDATFRELRDASFEAVGPRLGQRMKALQSDYKDSKVCRQRLFAPTLTALLQHSWCQAGCDGCGLPMAAQALGCINTDLRSMAQPMPIRIGPRSPAPAVDAAAELLSACWRLTGKALTFSLARGAAKADPGHCSAGHRPQPVGAQGFCGAAQVPAPDPAPHRRGRGCQQGSHHLLCERP